jgi:hypothetical protein
MGHKRRFAACYNTAFCYQSVDTPNAWSPFLGQRNFRDKMSSKLVFTAPSSYKPHRNRRFDVALLD